MQKLLSLKVFLKIWSITISCPAVHCTVHNTIKFKWLLRDVEKEWLRHFILTKSCGWGLHGNKICCKDPEDQCILNEKLPTMLMWERLQVAEWQAQHFVSTTFLFDTIHIQIHFPILQYLTWQMAIQNTSTFVHYKMHTMKGYSRSLGNNSA